MKTRRTTLLCSALALLVAAGAVAGCGSKKSSMAATLDISVADSGKAAKYTVPASAKGGLVKVTLTNHGKAPHGGQLVRIVGNHTPQQVVRVITSNADKTPEWIRGEGGPGTADPGGSATATVNLPAGKYIVGDFNGPSNKPAWAQFTVTTGKTGSLPSTPTTVTAANPSKDKYKWDISGSLKAGAQDLTFDSKGKKAIHLIAAFAVKGSPSKAALIKALKSNGKPPSFAQGPPTFTSVIDGGKSQVTSFTLQKPGKYVLFCPLRDRDGGKLHFEEGLLTTVTVK